MRRKNRLVFFVTVIIMLSAALFNNTAAAGASQGTDITIDYKRVESFVTSSDYTDYLRQLLDSLNGLPPSDAVKSALALYVKTAVSRLATVKLEAHNNSLLVRGDDIAGVISASENARSEFETLLDSYGITFNKTLTLSIRINAVGFQLSEPCQVAFSSDVSSRLSADDSVQLLLGDNRHEIGISAESLERIIAQYSHLTIHYQRTDFHEYSIHFVDLQNNIIDKLPENISFSLPAAKETATVLVDYLGGSDNWGGQYDSSNGAISFYSRYSGNYEVLESSVDVFDISGLSEEEQSIITFMVSKGYFTLSGNKFEPNRSLSRYDFTAALVKMFFALDKETRTSFTDVPEGSEYYMYVSSAEAGNIVRGAGNNLFNGAMDISKVEVVALCARTLAQKNGYSYPEDSSQYLQFSDNDRIQSWAISDVALAVREGLISGQGLLEPDISLSRSDSALILYRLFMLLYETPPVSFSDFSDTGVTDLSGDTSSSTPVDEEDSTIKTAISMLVNVLLIVAVVGFVVCMLLILGKKRGKQNNRKYKKH